ncbi:MAG: serine/threonine-protein kinase [Polyangiaceae bacterium]
MLAALGHSLRDGRYLLERKLGQGGFGAVYEALDRELGIRIALKILRRTEPDAIARFKREFRALASLVHPHLVVLHELGFDELPEGQGAWLYTMERVDGAHFGAALPGVTPRSTASATRIDPAAERVTTPDAEIAPISSSRPHRSRPAAAGVRGGAAPVTEDTLARLREVALALDFLHANGVLHCDIKPSNVIVHPTRGSIVVDFGLATLLEGGSSSSTSTGGGTPGYMAPEQIERAPLGPAADVYALGAMMFEAIAGRLPFEGSRESVIAATRRLDAPRLRALGIDVPDALDALVARMLEREPALRPTAEEVAHALAPGEEASASGARGSEPSRPRASSSPAPGAPKALRSAASLRGWPIVGRTDELARVLTFARGASGALACIAIVGPSGIGKSTLVESAKAELRDRTVLEARCYERERSPVEVIDGIARSLLELATRAIAAPETAASAALIRAKLRLLAPLAPSVVEAHPEAPAAAVGGYGRERALDALVAALRAAAQIAPVALVVEDLHWLDADGAACLARVLLDGEAPPVVLLVTARPGPSLGESLVEALRSSTRARGDARPRAFERLACSSRSRSARRSNLAACARDRGRAVRGGRPRGARQPAPAPELALHIDSAVGADGARVAPTLASVIDRRVDAMPGATRSLLELAGIAGRPLAERVLVRAATRHAPSITSGEGAHALFTLISGGLLQREAPSCSSRRATRRSALPRSRRARARSARRCTSRSRRPSRPTRRTRRRRRSPGTSSRPVSPRAPPGSSASRSIVPSPRTRSSARRRSRGSGSRSRLHLPIARASRSAGVGARGARQEPARGARLRPRRARARRGRGARSRAPRGRAGSPRRSPRGGPRRARSGPLPRRLAPADDARRRARVARDRSREGPARRRARVALRGPLRERSGPGPGAGRGARGRGVVDGLGSRLHRSAARGGLLRAAVRRRRADGRSDPDPPGDDVRGGRRERSGRRRARGRDEAPRRGGPRGRADRNAARRGPIPRARAIASATLGAFPEAFRLCSATESLYRDHVRDAPWDRVTVQHYLLWSAFEVGRFDVLLEIAPTLYAEAARRGDSYGAARLAANYANLAWLLTDPRGAVAVVDACAAMWKGERFNLLSYDVALARVNERLFHGDAARALEIAERIHAELDRALFLHFEALRVDAESWMVARARRRRRGREDGARTRTRARATLAISALERALSASRRGSAASCGRASSARGRPIARRPRARGDRSAPRGRGLTLFGSLARRQAAELLGQRFLVAEIDASLAERGLHDAAAMARIFLPGARA